MQIYDQQMDKEMMTYSIILLVGEEPIVISVLEDVRFFFGLSLVLMANSEKVLSIGFISLVTSCLGCTSIWLSSIILFLLVGFWFYWFRTFFRFSLFFRILFPSPSCVFILFIFFWFRRFAMTFFGRFRGHLFRCGLNFWLIFSFWFSSTLIIRFLWISWIAMFYLLVRLLFFVVFDSHFTAIILYRFRNCFSRLFRVARNILGFCIIRFFARITDRFSAFRQILWGIVIFCATIRNRFLFFNLFIILIEELGTFIVQFRSIFIRRLFLLIFNTLFIINWSTFGFRLRHIFIYLSTWWLNRRDFI